jgi:hypothetical protein
LGCVFHAGDGLVSGTQLSSGSFKRRQCERQITHHLITGSMSRHSSRIIISSQSINSQG